MKNFFILVYMLYLVRLYLGLKVPLNISKQRTFNELLQCRICMELLIYDFNYDQYLKNKENFFKIKNFMNTYNKAYNGNPEEITNNKLEILSREISMKYFFKGNELDNDLNKINGCKSNNVKINTECESIKSRSCEFILSKESGKCVIEQPSVLQDPSITNNTNKEEFNNQQHISKKINYLIAKEKPNNSNFEAEDNDHIYSKNDFNSKNKDVNTINRSTNDNLTELFNQLNIKFPGILDSKTSSDNKAENDLDKLKQLLSFKAQNQHKNKAFNKAEHSEKMDQLNFSAKNFFLKSPKQNNLNNNNSSKNEAILPQFKPLENLSKELKIETENIINNKHNNEYSFNETEKTADDINKEFINIEQIKNLFNKQLSGGMSNIANLKKHRIEKNKHSKTLSNDIGKSSLLEIAPEVIESNYTPNTPQEIDKQDGSSSWAPPRPVLFDNFQESLGNQLKDISFLTK